MALKRKKSKKPIKRHAASKRQKKTPDRSQRSGAKQGATKGGKAKRAPKLSPERERAATKKRAPSGKAPTRTPKKSQAKKASEAAKRGWETRRAKAAALLAQKEKARRSAAAKRGWETRRLNQLSRVRRAKRLLKKSAVVGHLRVLVAGTAEDSFRENLDVAYAEKDEAWHRQKMADFTSAIVGRFATDLKNRVFAFGFVYRVSTRDTKSGKPIFEQGDYIWSTQYHIDYAYVVERAVSAVAQFGSGEDFESLKRGAYRLWLIALLGRTRKNERLSRFQRKNQPKKKARR